VIYEFLKELGIDLEMNQNILVKSTKLYQTKPNFEKAAK